MAACIGAAVVGARTFTATSAQGLALMHEMLHWAAGARLPIVMVNVNRAMAPPWSIWTDQNDSLSQRDTGWMQVYVESNQEVLDTVIMAYKVAERILLPAMIVLDAFVLSHTAEPVEIPPQELVDRYLPPPNFRYRLKPGDPRSYGALADPSTYFEFRYKQQVAMEKALDVWEEADAEFGQLFGRRYGIVEEYLTEDAEYLLLTTATVTSTARYTVHKLREQGEPVGLVKLRLFRPFPYLHLRRVLGKARKVGVIDRNLSPGAGGIFFQEIRSALYSLPERPKLFGYVAGLGGRDITPELIEEIYFDLKKREEPIDIIFKGVKP